MGGKWPKDKKLKWQRDRRHELAEQGFCPAHPTIKNAAGKKRCESCLKLKREESNANRFFLKLETLDAYGGICSCCGEEQPEFLTIEHLNNDGGRHRKETHTRAGIWYYLWLKQNGYPQDMGLTVRCFNCNCARSAYGECPHEEERRLAEFRKSQR